MSDPNLPDENASAASLRAQFEQLLKVSEAGRLDWLAQADLAPERRQQLIALLAADAQSATDFVAQTRAQLQSLLVDAPELSGAGSAQAGLQQDALLNQQFGPYLLSQWLGRGGMASVYVGERNDGKFKQQVAVKVLRQALHTDFERRLFQREQQALAALDHPNVARLLDGGVTESGLPYLVMELVRGKTLLVHCQDLELSPRARVALFVQVCDGVQAAHRALIVHRDIKPGNIVVSDQGQAKLLDFGVAKILHLDDDGTNPTQTFAPITPAYAAPEQFNNGIITTATDVYSLGMVLHELLTGARRKPGDTTRASELSKRTQAHGTSETVRFLRGDIDNILRQAMATEPRERYASAGDLAADLRRFLDGQPVQAHPPSGWYRTQKFVRRNFAAVMACSLLILGLIASLVYALGQAQIARVQTVEAQVQAKRATATRDFLVQLFEVSQAGVARTDIPSTETLLREGGQRVLSALGDAPIVRIELLNVIGGVQNSLGLTKDAKPLLEAALAQAKLRLSPADPQWLKAHAGHAKVALDERRFLPAIAELQDAIRQSAGINPDTEAMLQALKTLALAQAFADQFEAAALSTQQMQALAAKVYGAQSVQSYDALELAAEMAYQASRLEQSNALSSELLAQANTRFGPLHARTLEAKIARVQYLVAALKGDEAQVLAQSAAADLERIYPSPNATYLTVLNALAAVQFQNGDVDGSSATLERVNQLYLGPLKNQPGRDALLSNLSSIRIRQFRLDEALVLSTEALALASASYGTVHSETALVLRTRGQILARMERFPEAAENLTQAQRIFIAVDGPESPLALKLEVSLADIALRQGSGEKALLLLRPTLLRLRQVNPETHRDVLEARLWEIRALLLTKAFAPAAKNLPALLRDIKAAGPVAQYVLPIALQANGDALLGLGNPAQAQTAYTEALALRRAEVPRNEKTILALEQRLRELR